MKPTRVIPKAISEYDLRLLKIFVAVVEHNGLSSAASHLGITRSTMSIHMKTLETRMGYQLCNRGRAGFSLTNQGAEVYNGAIKLLASLNDFAHLVGSLSEELSGEAVILCADQLDKDKQHKLAQAIAHIHERYPKLHIVLDSEPIESIEKKLCNETAHIGLYPRYHTLDSLDYQHLSNEPIYLCCSHSHPLFLFAEEHITEQEIAKWPAIHPGLEITEEGRHNLARLKLAAKSYQFDTRKAMILSGKYIGYLPLSAITEELDSNTFRLLNPTQNQYQFELSLVTKKATKEPQKVNFLREVLLTCFN